MPANRASWDDIQTVFGPRGEAHRCQCQWFQTPAADWRETNVDERMARLRAETGCGHPRARTTSGLVAYLDGEPVGWCAVEPRSGYVRLSGSRVVWAERRDQDHADDGVWAVPCFVTRAGYRRRGISGVLLRAAVDHARNRAARALEGYPIVVRPGETVSWGELYVGSASTFAATGFREVSHPTTRRVVMRIDF